MGYGRDVSRYTERKRVVKDENLGPLVSTDMTRCIQCTRCVRFGEEIAGIQELGTVGRGELLRISTYVEKGVDHELSGNIIDLCPVGALNNKPYRYRARAWEMTQHPLVSPHDCVGANLYGHVLRGRLMRVVPRANEEINETWIADRDRFSCEGLYTEDRARRPMAKHDGTWSTVDWETALADAAAALRKVVDEHGADSIGFLVAPGATLEEHALAARLARGLGCANIDHRLRQIDVRDQDADPQAPLLGCGIGELETASAVLVVGSQLRADVPLIAHRLRKGAVSRGTKVALIGPRPQELLFPVEASLTSNGLGMGRHLAAILLAASSAQGRAVPASLKAAVEDVSPSAAHERIAALLASGELRLVLLGALAQRHPAWSEIRALAAALAAATGARLGYLPDGGNAVGAALAGSLPHRGPAGSAVARPGLAAAEMLGANLKAWVLVGGIEAEDFAVPSRAASAFSGAQCVIALSPYAGAEQLAASTILLPVAAFPETSGTWVNVEGRWQSVPGAARPPGEARPAWKVLRVLGNLLGLAGFDYASSEDVREELRREIDAQRPAGRRRRAFKAGHLNGVDKVRATPIYRVDAVVRRSRPLQETRAGRAAAEARE
jgi:NADH-quinone oxidoreductase subunit G